MNKYNLYIGANNTTKELELDIIKNILNDFVKDFNTGYTIVESVGIWNGQEEKSCIVTIFDTDMQMFDIVGICHVLKDKLQQDSILVEYIEAITKFV